MVITSNRVLYFLHYFVFWFYDHARTKSSPIAGLWLFNPFEVFKTTASFSYVAIKCFFSPKIILKIVFETSFNIHYASNKITSSEVSNRFWVLHIIKMMTMIHKWKIRCRSQCYVLRLRPTPPTWNLKKWFLSQKNEFWAKNCAIVNFRSFRIYSWIWQKFNPLSHLIISEKCPICPFICPKCPFSPFLNSFLRFWA